MSKDIVRLKNMDEYDNDDKLALIIQLLVDIHNQHPDTKKKYQMETVEDKKIREEKEWDDL